MGVGYAPPEELIEKYPKFQSRGRFLGVGYATRMTLRTAG